MAYKDGYLIEPSHLLLYVLYLKNNDTCSKSTCISTPSLPFLKADITYNPSIRYWILLLITHVFQCKDFSCLTHQYELHKGFVIVNGSRNYMIIRSHISFLLRRWKLNKEKALLGLLLNWFHANLINIILFKTF